MTSSDNKALMQRIYAKLADGDGALFVKHLHDDVTMTVTGHYSWSQTFTGKRAVLRDLYAYVGSLMARPGKTIAYKFLADEDWVVVLAHGDMQTRSGQPYRNDYCLMYRIEDGQIMEMKEYQDSALCERVLGPYPRSPMSVSPNAGSYTSLESRSASRFYDLGDGVAALEITTDLGIATLALIEDIAAATQRAAEDFGALVLCGAYGRFFSPGASADAFFESLETDDRGPTEHLLDYGQSTLQALKYAPIPVIAAVHGAAMSGGFEIAMHADAIVHEKGAGFGMRERWAGILPGWGGGAQMLLRLQQSGMDPADACAEMFSAFARVTIGAPPPAPGNLLVNDRAILIATAKNKALALAKDYTAPEPAHLTLAGRRAELTQILQDVREKENFAACETAACDAYIDLLCPSAEELVGEAEFMRRERDAFLDLLMTHRPVDRFRHLQATGQRPPS